MNVSMNTTDTNDEVAASGDIIKRISVKFTVFGVTDVTDASNFRSVMLLEFKSLLTLISFHHDGVKFTDISELYARRILQENDIFHLYYDVTMVSTDDDLTPATLLIDATKAYHTDILQKIQEYKENYYYVEDFELCTSSEGGEFDESMFDLCSIYDHELIKVQFGTVGLANDLDFDDFNKELIELYESILGVVDGLMLSGLYADEPNKTGDVIDFHYTVDILQKEDRSMRSAVIERLDTDDAKAQLLNHFVTYTSKEACITKEGRYSNKPCARSMHIEMPSSQIVFIAIATLFFVSGFCVWYIMCRRKEEEKEFNAEVRDFRRSRYNHEDELEHYKNYRHRMKRKYEYKQHRNEKQRHRRREKSNHHHRRYRRRTEDSSDSHSENFPTRQLVIQVPQTKQQTLHKQFGPLHQQRDQTDRKLPDPPEPQPKLLQVEGP